MTLGAHHDWRPRVVAERFGQLGRDAVPILAAHLAEQDTYGAGWTVYALQLTGSDQADEPLVEFSTKLQGGTFPPLISDTLQSFPSRSTVALIPLLSERERSHLAISQLGMMRIRPG